MKTSIFKGTVLFLALGLVSCEGEELLGGEGSVEQQLSEYLLEAEGIANNLYNKIDLARRDSSFINTDSTTIDGAVVTGNQDTITIDFTTAGTYGSDGKLRKGMVKAVETGSYLMVGGKISASLLNFSVDDVPVTGDIELQNQGNDSLTLKVTGLSVDNAYRLNSDKGIKWVAGFSTFQDVNDDIYRVGGDSDLEELGTNNGIGVVFTESLLYDRTCQFGVVSGILDLTLSGDSVRYNSGSIDFIANDCNNAVNLTITTGDATLNFVKTFSGF